MDQVKDHIEAAAEGTLRRLAGDIEAARSELVERERAVDGLVADAEAKADAYYTAMDANGMDEPEGDAEREAREAYDAARREAFRTIDRIKALRDKVAKLTSDDERERRLHGSAQLAELKHRKALEKEADGGR